MSQDYDDYQKQYHQLNNAMGYNYSSHSGNQPPDTYRDPSLYPTPETQAATMTRRRRFRILRTFIQIGFVLLPFIGAWILTSHYAATYNTYQKGTCTLTSKDVNESDSKDKYGNITSRTYYPTLSYDVHTADGTQASATGYDGPTATGYSYSGDAEVVIDQYQIGENVPCWYNPVSPDKAFIIFYGFSSSDSAKISFWSTGGIGAFALILYLIFDWSVWRLYALQKRGVVTRGTVTEITQNRDRYGRIHYHSILSFQAQEEPGRTRTISVAGDLGVGTILPVCYDPLFPRYRHHGEWPDPAAPNGGVMGMVIVTLIGLVILLAVWLVP